MKRFLPHAGKACLALSLMLVIPVTMLAADKLPPELAGEIGSPEGMIAFVREGNVWAMDVSGSNQQLICESSNADGRLTWSPDGKSILFTRSGLVDLKAPDFSGGRHKVYDIFLASLDSAYQNRAQWWGRLTEDLGSRDPELSADGSTVLFWKDFNANTVNAFQPDYQLCTMTPDGQNLKLLRDRRESLEAFLITPSMNPNGDIACVAMFDQKPQGLLVLPKGQYTLPVDSAKARALENSNCVVPAWSSDGKWLAYINNNMNDGSLYIATPDLKQKYVVFTPPPTTSLYTVAPSFSPDSKWITFSTTDGSIWISDITGNSARRLSGPGNDKFPAWSKTP